MWRSRQKISQRITVTCAQCGELLARTLSQIRGRTRSFCNHQCHALWQADRANECSGATNEIERRKTAMREAKKAAYARFGDNTHGQRARRFIIFEFRRNLTKSCNNKIEKLSACPQ